MGMEHQQEAYRAIRRLKARRPKIMCFWAEQYSKVSRTGSSTYGFDDDTVFGQIKDSDMPIHRTDRL
jgi:hypothetical protein